MEQLVKLYRETALGHRLPAYDGRKSLYTAGPLPFQSKEFQISLLEEDDGNNSKRFEYRHCCETISSNYSLLHFLALGQGAHIHNKSFSSSDVKLHTKEHCIESVQIVLGNLGMSSFFPAD
jgi:hypothetical protein